MSNSLSDQQTNSKELIDSKYKKIYRSIVDTCKKLDEIYKNSNAFHLLFQNETTILRDKLQKYCEILIFRQPIEFGKKCEEILWRRCFYEIINVIKSNKKNLKSNTEIETMYRLHLTSAYGFYNHLIIRFQTEFGSVLNLDGFLNFPLLSYEKQTPSQTHEKVELLKEVILRILHKFLICLGDLTRYQLEYDPNRSAKKDPNYYLMSLMLLPSNGMPLNQLGTLFGSENYGCDAAYYYLYSLNCIDPFMGAKENLKLLFLKNRKRYQEIISKNYIDRSKIEDYDLNELRSKEIKKFLVLFLHVIELILSQTPLFMNPSMNQINNQQLQELCQICLQQFNSCMFYNKKQNDQIESSIISDDLVFKLQLLILMSIEQLKLNNNNNNNNKNNKQANTIYFTSVAYALVFFTHIVNHTIIRFQEKLFNLNSKQQNDSLFMNTNSNDEDTSSDLNSLNTSQNRDDLSNKQQTKTEAKSNEKNLKKKLRLIYGHRRREHNSDSDTNESEDAESFENERSFNSEDDTTTVHSSDSGTRSNRSNNNNNNRRRRGQVQPRRRVNVGKFLERENLSDLSETELNVKSNSSDSDSDSTSSSASTSESDQEEKEKKISQMKQQNKPQEIKKIHENEIVNLNPIIDNINENDFLQMNNLNLNNNLTINFKELSLELFSNFSQSPQITSSSINYQAYNDEFIDNEVYKFVLNGKKQVSIPPGFEANSKEIQEIEELGKKIATFQIDTDTEVNTDENSISSDEEKYSNDQNQSTNLNKYEDDKQLHNLENAKVLINVFQSQSLLPSIKVFCDWLLCNKKIIQSISKVSTSMWSKLAVLLNLIPFEKQIATICDNEYVRKLILKSSETKSWNNQPLAEDIHLRSFNALKLEHLSLKFDLNKLNQLSIWDEHLLRLCSLRRFGYLIASLSQSQKTSGNGCFFEYEIKKSLFIAHEIEEEEEEEEKEESIKAKNEIKNESKTDENKKSTQVDRRLQLMKSMAQLRLEAEISQLESTYKNDEYQWSPYLVMDTNLLCNSLKLVQELSRSNKFLIIIPLAVIDQIDMMKKESKLAREAIKWLEVQFKNGNRFLRAQNQNETISQKVDVSMKKKDIIYWRLDQIIDCCNYFQQQSLINNSNSNEMKKSNMVTLLMTKEDLNERFAIEKCKNLINMAKENHIEVTDAKEFYDKWKKSF